jgi:hypothetical protein
MYIDATKIEATIARVNPLLGLISQYGKGDDLKDLVAFLQAATSPGVIGPAVDLINQLNSATPPPNSPPPAK